MSFSYFLTMLISGLKLGSIYAIVAIGYSIVYGILRLINFAHGDIMTVGVYLILTLMNAMGMPILPALLISVGFSIGVGLLIERLAYRPLRDASEEATLISSLAVSALLQNLLQMVFSSQRQPFILPQWLTAGHQLGPVTVSTINMITIIVTVILLILLHFVLKLTRIGTAMRACSENLKAARLMGVNVNKVVMAAFAIGSGLAVLAGLLLAGEYKTVYPSLGFVPGLKAFCAAVIGGIGSMGGAVTGAFIIGVAEMLFAGLMPTTMTAYRDAFVFLLMVIMLLFRPNGLFGGETARS
ncbi:MAG: branched-chain amino acid ABC transporter permease [Eubacterium sp.]|nr:branched-chain amino acid ABC transporter permease [Eubacterium sp.]